MAKERMVNTRFWMDDYISNLDPIEKLLFLYFLTNPSTDISGVYEVPLKTVAVDTGIDKEMVIKVVKRFEKDKKIKYVDGWVAVKNFIKHQKENPKVARGIEISMTKCPQWCIDYLDYDDSNIETKERSIRKKIPQATRDYIFERDGRKCQMCGIEENNVMYEIDHITPFRDGGGNEIDNLRVLCQQCNGKRNAGLSMGSLSHSNPNSNPNSNSNTERWYSTFKVSEQLIIKTMYNYVICDESGNPIKHPKIKKRISQEENKFLISVGMLWLDMASKALDMKKEDVVMKNIYYPIRECYLRDKFKKEDFQKLFDYFFKDSGIKYENKLAFDLCLSQKYVAKFKLSRNNQNISNADIIKNIKL